MKKSTVKSVSKAFEAYKTLAKKHFSNIGTTTRMLLSVDAADEKGQLNGMTIVELITIVRLSENTNERVYLTVRDKTITMWAVSNPPALPAELR